MGQQNIPALILTKDIPEGWSVYCVVYTDGGLITALNPLAMASCLRGRGHQRTRYTGVGFHPSITSDIPYGANILPCLQCHNLHTN